MTIQDLYQKYQIPPNLQLHQLRVAAVASIICNHVKGPIDTRNVLLTCLLHDMGNIIKFNLALFPEFLEPEGLIYWKDVQDRFKRKYGLDEHLATKKIVKEIGVPQKVGALINNYGFSKAFEVYKSDSNELKIATYSDHRVAPFGVVSMKRREEDGRERYVKNKNAKFDEAKFSKLIGYWYKTEQQIFMLTNINPEYITAERANKLVEKLRQFKVE